MENYIVEMLNITKEFPGIIANDNITLNLKRGEVHALLGENGAGKSTLMSVLFGLYQAEKGEIRKNGEVVKINNPNDANALGIGMVHQHFKLVEIFTVLENIILGVEPNKLGFLQKSDAKKKVVELSERYGLSVNPDALIEDISVGMQQRVEILKMLYRENEILIFDEPTAVLTPQEIKELLKNMICSEFHQSRQVPVMVRALLLSSVSVNWLSGSAVTVISLFLLPATESEALAKPMVSCNDPPATGNISVSSATAVGALRRLSSTLTFTA